MDQSEEKLTLTYAKIDKALLSDEGLLCFRIVTTETQIELQEFIDGEWRLSKTRYGRPRVSKYMRLILRDVYQLLRETGKFDPESEIYTQKFLIPEYARQYGSQWQAENWYKKDKQKPINTQIENQAEYAHQLKSTLLERVIAYEGDGILQPYSDDPATIKCIYKGKTHYLALADDGISGPLLVAENKHDEHFSITGDKEEIYVLQQLLANPWIKPPFEI